MSGSPTRLRTMCRRRPDDVCHLPPEISNEVSLSCRLRVIRVSSAHGPPVVRTRLQFPDYFKLNSRGQLC